MDSYFIGQILLWPNRYVPAGWALCNGQALQVNYYQALYSIIGNIYGGNSTSFNLPNLNNSVVIGQGLGPGLHNYQLAAKGGETTVALTASNLPPHNHTAAVQNNGAIAAAVNVSKNPGTSNTPNPNLVVGGLSVDSNTSNLTSASLYNAGGGTPCNMPLGINVTLNASNPTIGNAGSSAGHNNMMPYQNLFYIICTTDGLYPNFQ